jgi:hypothetical protein
MSDDRRELPRARARPRSKLFLTISLDNPYAQLGVSPLATTQEINDILDQRRSDANRRLKAKGAREADDPDEQVILQLDQISELIGDDRRRARYDARHPQNTVLTVQQSLSEQGWRRHVRAGLISEWLHDSEDERALLPTPRCLKLWAPGGVEPELAALLERFTAKSAPVDNSESTPSLSDLDKLTKED